MPEPVKGQYENEILNYGYVYTNLSNIEIKEDIARGYITIYISRRRTSYKPINLLSCYSKRHREKTRLSFMFIEIFLKKAKDDVLKKKINIKAKNPALKLISDWKEEDIDALSGKIIKGEKSIMPSGLDLQRLFDFFVRKQLSPFYPEDRSVGRVKEAIYKFFETEFEMKRGNQEDEVIKISLSDENIQHFINLINITKEEYIKEAAEREPELIFNDNWNVPELLRYNENFNRMDCKKSIMNPFYSDEKWKTESAFIEFLEKSKKLVWWFKNGDRDSTFFAVPYKENNTLLPFYVDFVVKFNDGSIGLFDTKKGITTKIAGPKAEGLQKYINEQNEMKKKLWGGIVINVNGTWRYNYQLEYKYDTKNLSDWKILEI